MTFWEWLSGKKTVIGSILLWLVVFAQDVIIGEIGFNPAWLSYVITFFTWLGGILVPVGISHKLAKKK